MTNNEGRLNIEIQSQRNEIIRLREENERLHSTLRMVDDQGVEALLKENEENKQHALRLFRELEPLHRKYEQARELLGEWCRTHRFGGKRPYVATRAFLDGEDK